MGDWEKYLGANGKAEKIQSQYSLDENHRSEFSAHLWTNVFLIIMNIGCSTYRPKNGCFFSSMTLYRL